MKEIRMERFGNVERGCETRSQRPRTLKASALPLLGLILTACDGSLVSPEQQLDPEPCQRLAQVAAGVPAEVPIPAALRSALMHAAGPMALGLPEGAATAALVSATTELGMGLDALSGDSECRALISADAALERIPDDPASLPDRTGIRLVLDVAARALVQWGVR
jgi:hypothetical protein